MAKENSAGLGVANNYGPRQTEESRAGELPGTGTEREYRLSFNGGEFTDIKASIPAGSVVSSVFVKVYEAFDATADILVGTKGSEATNGGVLDATDLAAEGSYVVTGLGTWAGTAPLAADTEVALTSAGTATVGKGVVVIRTYRAA